MWRRILVKTCLRQDLEGALPLAICGNSSGEQDVAFGYPPLQKKRPGEGATLP